MRSRNRKTIPRRAVSFLLERDLAAILDRPHRTEEKMARTIVTGLAIAGLLASGLSAAIAAEAEAPDFQHNPYLKYSCKDLVAAAAHAARRAEQDVGVKSETALHSEAGETTIFWPKAFLVKASGGKASDLSRLKEDMISIEQAAIEGECQIQFDGPRPPGA
jgi:hypothetical protein